MTGALLLLDFSGALRRSKLVAVQGEHLRFTDAGLRLLLPSSKIDQDGRGGRARHTAPRSGQRLGLSLPLRLADAVHNRRLVVAECNE